MGARKIRCIQMVVSYIRTHPTYKNTHQNKHRMRLVVGRVFLFFWLFFWLFVARQVGQFLLSSGFCDTDEESEEKCQALAGGLQKVGFIFLFFLFFCVTDMMYWCIHT